MMTMTFRNDGRQEPVEVGGLRIKVSFTDDAPANATADVVVENATQPVTVIGGDEACVTVNGLAMLARGQNYVTIFKGGVSFTFRYVGLTIERIPCPTDKGGEN